MLSSYCRSPAPLTRRWVPPGGPHSPRMVHQLTAGLAADLKIVENLLVAQLPKIEDIQLAQGRVKHIAEVRVAVSQTTDRTVVAATDGAAANTTRKVGYTVTATNVSAAAVGPAVLNVEVKGTTDWKQKGTVANVTCNQDAAKENLRCDITTLAANGVVKVEIEAVAPAAIAIAQRIHLTGQVWDASTKLPLSGAANPVIVNIAAQ